MEKAIAWQEGGDILHLSYNGNRNEEIVFWSDSPNNTGHTRSMEVTTISTTKGNTVKKNKNISVKQ